MNAAKVHVHMSVSDLEKSKDFYTRFFGVLPVKSKPGYVKFLPELGPVNLALTKGQVTVKPDTVNHMGIQVDSTEVVMRELARVRQAGLSVEVEENVDCCHANQDKFWVQDPDGVRWEVYHLNYDLETEASEPAGQHEASGATAPCCAPTCCSSE